MHVLMKAFMEGLGASKRGGGPVSAQSKDIPPAKPFTDEEFQQLAGLMGGVHHVSGAPQAVSNG